MASSSTSGDLDWVSGKISSLKALEQAAQGAG